MSAAVMEELELLKKQQPIYLKRAQDLEEEKDAVQKECDRLSGELKQAQESLAEAQDALAEAQAQLKQEQALRNEDAAAFEKQLQEERVRGGEQNVVLLVSAGWSVYCPLLTGRTRPHRPCS